MENREWTKGTHRNQKIKNERKIIKNNKINNNKILLKYI